MRFKPGRYTTSGAILSSFVTDNGVVSRKYPLLKQDWLWVKEEEDVPSQEPIDLQQNCSLNGLGQEWEKKDGDDSFPLPHVHGQDK